MRILMIADFYWPFLGGVEQHVRSLSHELAVRGHDVAVATSAAERFDSFAEDGPVRIYRIPTSVQRVEVAFSHRHRPWLPPFPDPEATLALRGIINRERPDVVHGHDWLARSFLPLKHWCGVPLVSGLHYYTLSCARKDLVRNDTICTGPGFLRCQRCATAHYGAAKGLPVTYGNWLGAGADRWLVDMFLPVSRAVAAGNRLIGSKLPYRILPNFLSSAVSSGVQDVPAYLEQLPREPFLLFVGDLRRAKGINTLLEAYEGIRDAPPLVLIGKAWKETPTLPAGVCYLPNWPNPAVLEAWKRSMLAIVPSEWPEPFGIVVIEAMAAGRPVVATRVGGIPEIIQDGENGLLVPPANARELRSALERLVGDEFLRSRLGAAAARRADEFSAKAIVPRYEAVYRDLLQSRRAADPVACT